MYSPEISISVVSVLVHVIALLTLFFASRIAARLLRLLSNLRLKNAGSAPVVFDSYASIPGSLVISVSKLSLSSSGTTIVFIALLLLVPAEIALDFGVETSDRCFPRRLETKGLCESPRPKNNRIQLNTFFNVVSIRWDEQFIGSTSIRQGFRRQVEGNEYFGPVPRVSKSVPVVISGCRRTEYDLLNPQKTSLSLGFNHKLRIGSKIALANKVFVDESERATRITITPQYLLGYSMPPQKLGEHGFSITAFESFDTVNVNHLLSGINRSKTWSKLRVASPIVRYNISCSSTGLSLNDAWVALLSFRITQLELERFSTFNFSYDGRSISALQPMSRSSITKAILALKFSETELCNGETWIWTKCGTVDYRYALPVYCILLLLCVMWLVMEAVVRVYKLEHNIPMSVVEWHELATSVIGADFSGAELEYAMTGSTEVKVRRMTQN